MTKLPQISQDDLMDVMEMTHKMEKYIMRVLRGQEPNLGMSALISVTVNCLWAQCKSFDEVIYYRHMLMEVLDKSIRHMQIKKPEKPSS